MGEEGEVTRRVRELVQATGQSERAISLLVSDGRNQDVVRDIMRRNAVPKTREVQDKLAEALETTVEYLVYGRRTGGIMADRRTGYDPGPVALAAQPILPRNLPVRGTALGADLAIEDDGDIAVESHLIEHESTIDWLQRPQLLNGRDGVFALYVHGSSMEPKFEPGEAIIVDSKRPPALGDYVVVQVAEPDGEQDHRRVALIKRLIRRNNDGIELEQFNPPATFRVPRHKIEAIFRVIPTRELLG